MKWDPKNSWIGSLSFTIYKMLHESSGWGIVGSFIDGVLKIIRLFSARDLHPHYRLLDSALNESDLLEFIAVEKAVESLSSLSSSDLLVLAAKAAPETSSSFASLSSSDLLVLAAKAAPETSSSFPSSLCFLAFLGLTCRASI